MVRGINVRFPYPPYRTQKSIASHIINSLNSATHTLIESPTGTGKSLVLLCSSLSWIQHQKLLKKQGLIDTDFKIPKIYYGVRTIRQSVQLITELEKLNFYSYRVDSLASREFYCINKNAKKTQNVNEACNKMTDPTTDAKCMYFQNLRKLDKFGVNKIIKNLPKAWDIEDLVYAGETEKICPYFAARDYQHSADLVICPYNYLLDEMIKSSGDISTKDNIVILDEAHNIENVCRDSASQTISTNELLEVSWDLNKVLFCKPSEIYRPFQNFITHMISKLKILCSDLPMKDAKSGSTTVDHMKSLYCLSELGMNEEIHKDKLRLLSDVCDVESKHEQDLQKDPKSGVVLMTKPSMKTVEKIAFVLKKLYSHNACHFKDFCIVLGKDHNIKEEPSDQQLLTSPSKLHQTALEWNFQIGFECLLPQVGMAHLLDCRSLILASGTLSPLDSFGSELGVEFKSQFSSFHVTPNENINPMVVTTSRSNYEFLGNYRNLNSFKYQDELGETLTDILKSVDNGVLLFLPSYFFLTSLMNRWQQSGRLRAIKEHKDVFVEPRRGKGEEFDKMIKKFNKACKSKGALIIGVYRGKLSEGIDFKNELCRAVICVGIPYPNVKEPLITKKINYNDQNTLSKKLLKGSDWYEIQAFRALNQAVGRCIRHINDWGSIILIDSRLASFRYNKRISKWVQQLLKVTKTNQEMVDLLTGFSKSMVNKPKEQKSDGETNDVSDSDTFYVNPKDELVTHSKTAAEDGDQQSEDKENINTLSSSGPSPTEAKKPILVTDGDDDSSDCIFVNSD